MKKVGIYAGTFDPIHMGHISFAYEAAEQAGLDRVFFLVEPRPRRKQGVRALEHRLRMTQIAIDNEPKFGTIVMDQGQFSVAETLPILTARFKGAELHMLMGDDVVAHLSEWPNVSDLISACSFIIGVRKKAHVKVQEAIDAIESTRGLTFRYRIFEAPDTQYASSTIRKELKRGEETPGLLPSVRSYIKQHGLYVSSGPNE